MSVPGERRRRSRVDRDGAPHHECFSLVRRTDNTSCFSTPQTGPVRVAGRCIDYNEFTDCPKGRQEFPRAEVTCADGKPASPLQDGIRNHFLHMHLRRTTARSTGGLRAGCEITGTSPLTAGRVATSLLPPRLSVPGDTPAARGGG